MVDYRKRLGFWEAVFMAVPACVLLWALASGHGPLMFIWLVAALVAVTGIRFVILLGRLLWPSS